MPESPNPGVGAAGHRAAGPSHQDEARARCRHRPVCVVPPRPGASQTGRTHGNRVPGPAGLPEPIPPTRQTPFQASGVRTSTLTTRAGGASLPPGRRRPGRPGEGARPTPASGTRSVNGQSQAPGPREPAHHSPPAPGVRTGASAGPSRSRLTQLFSGQNYVPASSKSTFHADLNSKEVDQSW